ncbi:MAG: hypothetical protein AAF085_10120 [Planctomycetota bacterium]
MLASQIQPMFVHQRSLPFYMLLLSICLIASIGCGEDQPGQSEIDAKHTNQPSARTAAAPAQIGNPIASPWLKLGEDAHYAIDKPYKQALFLSRFIPQYLEHGDAKGYETALARFNELLQQPGRAGQRWLLTVRNELIKKLGEAGAHAEVIRQYNKMLPTRPDAGSYPAIITAVTALGDDHELERVLKEASLAIDDHIALIDQNPTQSYTDAITPYLVALIRLGMHDEAMSVANRSPQIRLHNFIATLLHEQDNPRSAKLFTIAAIEQPDVDKCWLELVRYHAELGDVSSTRNFGEQVNQERYLLVASVWVAIAEAKQLNKPAAIDRLDAWWKTTTDLRWNDPRKRNIEEAAEPWMQFMVDHGWLAEAEQRLHKHFEEHRTSRGIMASMVIRGYAKLGDLDACQRVVEAHKVRDNNYGEIRAIPYGLIEGSRVQEAMDLLDTIEETRWGHAGFVAEKSPVPDVLERLYGWVEAEENPSWRAVACLDVLEALAEQKEQP